MSGGFHSEDELRKMEQHPSDGEQAEDSRKEQGWRD